MGRRGSRRKRGQHGTGTGIESDRIGWRKGYDKRGVIDGPSELA